MDDDPRARAADLHAKGILEAMAMDYEDELDEAFWNAWMRATQTVWLLLAVVAYVLFVGKFS
jgi:hypothetical protein